jgi:ABC-2 type transport system permease protein
MNLSRVLGVFLRYFYVAKKGPQQLSDLFYWPFVDILLWGLTSSWIQRQSHLDNLPLILMTALIFWQIVWRSSQDISISLLQEFWHRNLINLFSTPLKISEWITGILLLGLCKLGICICFGTLMVFILYSLNVFSIGLAFIPFGISLALFGWTISFCSASAIIFWGHKVEVFAWMIGFLFAPFSAVFYPIDVLPKWAQTISWCLPTTYIFQGMRCILSNNCYPLIYFWISIGLNALYLTLAILLFRWAFEKSRQKGLGRLE